MQNEKHDSDFEIVLKAKAGNDLVYLYSGQLDADGPPYDRPELDKRLLVEIEAFHSRELRRVAQRRRRIAAMFALSLVGAAAVLTLSIDAVRVPLLNFFTRHSTTHSEYGPEVTQAQLAQLGFVYAPSYIPEGYNIIAATGDDNIKTITYSNATGDTFIFEQYTAAITYAVDDETQISTIDIGGTVGELRQGKGTILTWEFYGFMYLLSGQHLGPDEAVNIANSLAYLQ